MRYIERSLEKSLRHHLSRGKSILLLGPRQTGKTTLVKTLRVDWTLNFIQPHVRIRYEKQPSIFTNEVEDLKRNFPKRIPLIAIDEIQKIPQLLDAIQDLIDRKMAQFILTGSSARKLKRNPNVNLLPGRIVTLHLDPFSMEEQSPKSLEAALLDGSLPGIMEQTHSNDKEVDLRSYVTTYLEEEIRSESIVRSIGHFAKFLELAATEAGRIVSFRSISQEIGVAHTTVQAYYQILEDCLIVERISPITRSTTRKKLTKSDKYLFFDMGVRRVSATEGRNPPKEHWGHLFEHFIGLELLRWIRIHDPQSRLKFWRDPDGPEVDWIVEIENRYIPVEVKWTETPSHADARHVEVFLSEYSEASHGFVICRTPRSFRITDRIRAIPWQETPHILKI
jgi:predicted AAA+ superfamily ATPase